jgi:hypothetical protein
MARSRTSLLNVGAQTVTFAMALTALVIAALTFANVGVTAHGKLYFDVDDYFNVDNINAVNTHTGAQCVITQFPRSKSTVCTFAGAFEIVDCSTTAIFSVFLPAPLNVNTSGLTVASMAQNALAFQIFANIDASNSTHSTLTLITLGNSACLGTTQGAIANLIMQTVS